MRYTFSLIGIVLSLIFRESCMFAFLPLQAFLWVKRRYGASLPLYSRIAASPLVFYGLLGGVVASVFVIASRRILGEPDFVSYFLSIIAASVVLTLLTAHTGASLVWGNRPIVAVWLGLLVLVVTYLPRFNIYPSYSRDSEFVKACEWITLNTRVADVFLTEPFGGASDPLRLLCRRGVFLNGKDGAQVVFNRVYAVEWKKRLDLVQQLEGNFGLLSGIVREYNVGYILASRQLALDDRLVFRNEKYFVYKVQ